MLNKYLAIALLSSALLAPVAYAAETPAAPGATAAQADTGAYHGDWRASKIVGVNVYNNNNENVGSINDLLMDKSGAIKAVVIGVGGFLGMGEHLVAVSFDKIKFVDEPVYTAASTNNTRPPSTATNPPTSPPSTTTTGAAPSTNTPPAATASAKSDWYPDHAVFNATKDELKAMPQFSYSK